MRFEPTGGLVVQSDNFAVNNRIMNGECRDRVVYFREFAAQILIVSGGIRISLPLRSAYGAVTVGLNFVDPIFREVESTSIACIGAAKPGTGAVGILAETSETLNG